MSRKLKFQTFLGFKKESGKFRTISELLPEAFYQLDNLPSAYTGRITEAIIHVLRKPGPADPMRGNARDI